jgi:hypothetical protein
MSAHWRDYTDQLTPEQIALIAEYERKLAASMALKLVATAEMAMALNEADDDELDRMERWIAL